MTDRDYSKSNRQQAIPFHEAVDSALAGWVCSRDAWPAGKIIFLAKQGTFVASDLTTGFLGPFMIVRTPDGKYHPWMPSQDDMQAKDWIAITRQSFASQMPVQRATEPGEREETRRIPHEDYVVDADIREIDP
jgi:Protein of unknown function (DUF2829)